MKQALSYDGDAYRNFIHSLKSFETRRTYARCLNLYLDYNHVKEPNKLLKEDFKLMQANLIEYLTSQKVCNLAYSTKHLYFSVLKHFYEINDISLNWKKISKYLGEHSNSPSLPSCEDIVQYM